MGRIRALRCRKSKAVGSGSVDDGASTNRILLPGLSRSPAEGAANQAAAKPQYRSGGEGEGDRGVFRGHTDLLPEDAASAPKQIRLWAPRRSCVCSVSSPMEAVRLRFPESPHRTRFLWMPRLGLSIRAAWNSAFSEGRSTRDPPSLGDHLGLSRLLQKSSCCSKKTKPIPGLGDAVEGENLINSCSGGCCDYPETPLMRYGTTGALGSRNSTVRSVAGDPADGAGGGE